MAKISEEQAQEMYRKYTEEGATYKALAQEYDVSIPTAVKAVSAQEAKHRWDDPNKAPLVCDQEAAPAVPQSVVDAISDTIALLSVEIDNRVLSIKEQQREVENMRSRLAELKKWKEAQQSGS